MLRASKVLIGVCLASIANSAFAGSHTWDFTEVFTNADGSVQFIELQECCGSPGETNLGGKQVRAVNAGNIFTFPANLVGDTSNAHLLLATQAFADLPGAPTPDYIIPAGFLPLNGDELEYDIWDDWLYSMGDLPTDGIMSLQVTQPSGGVPVVNSPTNFNGESGSVDASGDPIVPATSEWGMLVMALLTITVGTVVFARFRQARRQTA